MSNEGTTFGVVIADTRTSENMGSTVIILSLGGTEAGIHMGVIPPIATYVCKKSSAILQHNIT